MEGLSTRGRYATRVLLHLFVRGAGRPVKISEIADAEAIPQQYLEQLLIRLKVAGFVRSVRGARGGYVAACDPARVTVGDVLAAVEGPVQLAPCTREHCNRVSVCVTRTVWQAASDAMNRVFDSVTLASMAEDARRRTADKAAPDYSI